MTSIEWTEKTWNPVTGCNKISAGCAHCYAADIAKRFWGDRPFESVQFHPERLEEPLRRRKTTMWFVNSMSDLFHEKVADEQLDQVFAVMALTPHHTYQVLTKRPERMLEYFMGFSARSKALGGDRWLIHETAIDLLGEEEICNGKYQDQKMCDLPLPNVWLGVTVENQKEAEKRIPLLLKTPAAVRFLSVEPMLEEINLELISDALYDGGMPFEWQRLNDDKKRGIKWVICGGESGSKARLFRLHWARNLKDQCDRAGVPFFMKQIGSNCPEWEASGKGGKIEELPKDLQIRQMPNI